MYLVVFDLLFYYTLFYSSGENIFYSLVNFFPGFYHYGPPSNDNCPAHTCNSCGRGYKHLRSLWLHQKYECGKPPGFKCHLCDHVCKLKGNLKKHVYTHYNKPPSMIS